MRKSYRRWNMILPRVSATKMIRSLEDPELASVPVIAVTANAFAEDIQDALDAGMDGHIAKPLDPQMIAKVLRPIILGSTGGEEEDITE